MIAAGSVLQPRSDTDPVVIVIGTVEDRLYRLENRDTFASVFDLDIDELAASYQTDGLALSITPYSEQDQWLKLSSENVSAKVFDSNRREKRQKQLLTPEEALALAE